MAYHGGAGYIGGAKNFWLVNFPEWTKPIVLFIFFALLIIAVIYILKTNWRDGGRE